MTTEELSKAIDEQQDHVRRLQIYKRGCELDLHEATVDLEVAKLKLKDMLSVLEDK